MTTEMPFKAFPFWCEAHGLKIARIRWEGNRAIADVGREEQIEAMKDKETEKAATALKKVIKVYKASYKANKSPQQRIADGAAYVQAHPEDKKAPAQLAELRQLEAYWANQIIEATHAYDVARGDAPAEAEIAAFLGSVA